MRYAFFNIQIRCFPSIILKLGRHVCIYIYIYLFFFFFIHIYIYFYHIFPFVLESNERNPYSVFRHFTHFDVFTICKNRYKPSRRSLTDWYIVFPRQLNARDLFRRLFLLGPRWEIRPSSTEFFPYGKKNMDWTFRIRWI